MELLKKYFDYNTVTESLDYGIPIRVLDMGPRESLGYGTERVYRWSIGKRKVKKKH